MTAQSGMTKLAANLEERGLEANRYKTSYIGCWAEAFNKKTEDNLKITPLAFGDFTVKRKKSDKYLGHIIHKGGLTKLVSATIKERTGMIKGAIPYKKHSGDIPEATEGGRDDGSQNPVGGVHSVKSTS